MNGMPRDLYLEEAAADHRYGSQPHEKPEGEESDAASQVIDA